MNKHDITRFNYYNHLQILKLQIINFMAHYWRKPRSLLSMKVRKTYKTTRKYEIRNKCITYLKNHITPDKKTPKNIKHKRFEISTYSKYKGNLFLISVPSMSSSWPWLPSRVRDRKGAKSTKVSLSRGATFSKACSSFVVILTKQIKPQWKEENETLGAKLEQIKTLQKAIYTWF